MSSQETAQTAVPGREYQGVSIPPTGTYELDPTHTVVGFVARHMLSKVRGQFTEFTGTIEVGGSPEDSRVDVEVKTGSITTHTEKRDQHLMSGDFLEIEKHPVLTFTSSAVRPTRTARQTSRGADQTASSGAWSAIRSARAIRAVRRAGRARGMPCRSRK